MKLINTRDCSLKDQLKECYESNNYSDVIFFVEHQRFFSHRSLLASSSSLLNGILRDFRNTENVDILLEGFSVDSIKKVLEFLYTGEVYLTDEELDDFQSSLNALGLESASTRVELAEDQTFPRNHYVSEVPHNSASATPAVDIRCTETAKEALATQTSDAHRKRPRKKLNSEKSDSSSSSPAHKKSHQSIEEVSPSPNGVSARPSSPDIEMLLYIPASTNVARNGSSTSSQSGKQLSSSQPLKRSKSKCVSIQNAALKKAANSTRIDEVYNHNTSLEHKKRPVSNISHGPGVKKDNRRTGEVSTSIDIEACSTKAGQCQPTSKESSPSQCQTLTVMRNHSEEVLLQIVSDVNPTSETCLPAASPNVAALTCGVSDISPAVSVLQGPKISTSIAQSVSVPASADFVLKAVGETTSAATDSLNAVCYSNAVASAPVVTISNAVDDTSKTDAQQKSSTAPAVGSSVAASVATTKWLLYPVYGYTEIARPTTVSSRGDDPSARLETPRSAAGLPFARLATLELQPNNIVDSQAGKPISQRTDSPVEANLSHGVSPQLLNANRSAAQSDRSNGLCKTNGKHPGIIEPKKGAVSANMPAAKRMPDPLGTKDSANNRSIYQSNGPGTAGVTPHAKQSQTESLERSSRLYTAVQPDFIPTVNPLRALEPTRSDLVVISQRPCLPSTSCIENKELREDASANAGNCLVDITVDDVLCQLDSEFAPLQTENQENTPVPRKAKKLKKIVIKICRTCKVEIKGDKNYNEHLKIHRMENPFPCRICPVRLKTKSSLKSHERRKHDISQLKCIVCGIKFLGRMHREQHIFACVALAAGNIQVNQPMNDNAQEK